MKQPQDWWKEPFENAWYPLASLSSDWKEKTKAEAKSLKQILGLPKGSRILDVACGVGRHSIALAELGYQVVGIDISGNYLETARARAAERGVDARFIPCDMRAIPFQGEFHGAINLFSSFGYFAKRSDDLKVLTQIYRALVPQGVLVIDNLNFDFVRKHFVSRSWDRLGDGTLWLEKREPLDLTTQIMRSDWIFVSPDGNRSEMHSTIRGYTTAQLIRRTQEAGFTKPKSHPPLGHKGPTLRLSPRTVLSVRKTAK